MSSVVQVKMTATDHGDAVRLLVVQPDENCDLDRMGAWLEAQGVVVEVVRPFQGETVPAHSDHDGLIVLGGFMSSYDDGDYPWLEDVRKLIRVTVEADTPLLGICLGAQLLAQAFGGEVHPGSNGLEAGIITINWTAAAAQNPVVENLPTAFRAAAFHQDAITELPQGALQLASSEKYSQQAFSYRSAVGLQFHPEITPARLRTWNAIAVAEQPEWAAHLEHKAQEFDREEAVVACGAGQLAEQFLRTVSRRVAQPQA